MKPSESADYARIASDLQILAADELFDLAGPLGARLVATVARTIRDSFDNEVDPDGVPWPALQSDYAAAKARLFPGATILVREGLLRAGIDGAGPTQAPDSAIYTYGTSEADRQEATFAEEGDAASNRPPRKFVDLTPVGLSESDRIFDQHFDQRITP